LGSIDFHDFLGYLMMPMALGMLWLEIKLMDWMVVNTPPQPAWPQIDRLYGVVPSPATLACRSRQTVK
jgi:hypothetical protein